jgi:two-component system sensor histidine kinase YesM
MHKFYLNSLFSRLFLSFLLVLIPIYATGVAIILWGQKTIQAEIENSTMAQIAFLENKLETEASRIKATQANFLNDSTVRKLANEYAFLPDYERYTLIGDINRRLLITEYGSELLHEAILHFPRVNKSISTASGFVDLQQNQLDILMHDVSSTYKPLLIQDGIIYILTAIPISDPNRLPVLMIESRISIPVLQNYLAQFEANEGSAIWLYSHDADKLIRKQNERFQEAAVSQAVSLLQDKKNMMTSIKVEQETYLLVSRYSAYLDASICELIPTNIIYMIPNTSRRLLWIFTFIVFIIAAFYSLSTYRYVHTPLKKIVHSFHELEDGNLKTQIDSRANYEFSYLYTAFNRMVNVLNQQIEKGYKLEIYNQQAELKQLQSQINPHFLYNTYFMLHRMIKEGDQENALALSDYLGKYMQYITRDAQADVTLLQELEHAVAYLNIQGMRYAGRIRVIAPDINKINEEIGTIRVPRLIFQPILENAFEHGLSSVIHEGIVRFAYVASENYIDFLVEDNNTKLPEADIVYIKNLLNPESAKKEVTGLLNVHKRIQILFGKECGISVRRSEMGGLAILLRMTRG